MTLPSLNCLALTFDIDWAPDWCVALCARICEEQGVNATFFATHQSRVLEDVARNPLFEIGIHPSFLPGSSQGEDPRSVLDHCLGLVPGATAMRTHGLVQSSALYALVGDAYPQIETDVSLLLPFHRNLEPTDSYLGARKRRVTRLPYFWEDDVAADWPTWNWDRAPEFAAGLRIYDFHPIHIALNLRHVADYQRLKASVAPRPLYDLSADEVAPYLCSEPGAQTYLRRLVASPQMRSFKISEITRAHRGMGL